jgi:hypothetical protein
MDNIHLLMEAAQSPSAEVGQHDSEQDIESVLLAAAGAIQRLIAERNALRKRASTQERELTHFRRQSNLIHDSYRNLTSEFVKQFQLVDSVVSNLVGEPTDQAGADTPEQAIADQLNGPL